MKYFCLHHKPAIERKNRLLEVFSLKQIEVEWVELYHPDTIEYSSLNISNRIHNGESLSKGEISLYLKHKHVLELQKEYGWHNVVILEDDVIIPNELNFNKYIEQAINEFDELNGDILNFGTAFNMHPHIIHPTKLVYHEPHFTTRCAHAYHISNRCIGQVIESLNVIDDAWDWKLNNIIKKYNLKSCYVEPGLHQSTLDGDIKSLLR
jgi:GR25 family glycosyltransferase involved in LPS biosynthesis